MRAQIRTRSARAPRRPRAQNCIRGTLLRRGTAQVRNQRKFALLGALEHLRGRLRENRPGRDFADRTS
eukprot:9108425-Pyramimonas_sp.AAC.1